MNAFGAKHFTLAPSIVKMSPGDLGQGLRAAAARSDRLQSKRTRQAVIGLARRPLPMLGAVPERRSSMNLPLRQRRARSLIERHALQASRVQHMAAAMMMAATRT
jgi:hypothetical protein